MTPGELFAKLWIEVSPHSGPMVSLPWIGRGAKEFTHLTTIIRNGDKQEVPDEVQNYLAGATVSFSCDLSATAIEQRAFVAMCALDAAAMDIHPSMPTRGAGRVLTLSTLLTRMKQARTATGIYGEHQNHRVIPKGRLTARRVEPEIDWASGANLETQFEYLTVLKPSADRFSVEIRVVPPSLSPTSNPPNRIGLAPIAEDADDLEFSSTARGGRPFLDARPRDAALLQDRTIESVIELLDRGAELIVLPELVVPEAAAMALSKALGARTGSRSEAVIVCGSGLTTLPGETGLHFNEAIVLNGNGVELFRQRKLHPFNMAGERMKACGLKYAKGFEGKPHMEDIEPDAKVVVRDLHGTGRMMVAICEDLEQETPVGASALATRPDWLITPVLDVSQRAGRWTHQRAIEIGRKTGSHLVVSCSSSLSVRQNKVSTLAEMPVGETGLAMLYAGASRRVKIVDASEDTSSPRTLVIQWEPSSWLADNVTAIEKRRR